MKQGYVCRPGCPGLCLPRAGIKGMYHHCLTKPFFKFWKWNPGPQVCRARTLISSPRLSPWDLESEMDLGVLDGIFSFSDLYFLPGLINNYATGTLYPGANVGLLRLWFMASHKSNALQLKVLCHSHSGKSLLYLSLFLSQSSPAHTRLFLHGLNHSR